MFQSKTENGYLISVPKTFHGYRCIRNLGCGSTSIVVLVEEQNTGKQYSAKIMSSHYIKKHNLVSSVENEISVLKSIDHPHIIKMKEYFEIKNEKGDDFVVIILDYCDKGDLLTYALNHKFQNDLQRKLVIRGFLESIEYLHNLGISHGDIKADNILLCNHSAKLCDFGYCRRTKEAGEESKNGTIYYAAPELFRKGNFDPFKTDIYAIGITLYSIFELTFPFKDGDQNYIIKQIVSGDLYIPSSMDKNLLHIILKCLDLNPKNRPTIEEILDNEFFDFGIRKHSLKNNNNIILQKTKLNEQNYSNSDSLSQDSIKSDSQLLNPYESNMKI